MFNKRERKQFEQWARRSLHGLKQSAMMVGVINGAGSLSDHDPEFALHIGHSLLAGKPLILTVPHGLEIPPKLVAVADRIVRYDPAHPESMQPGIRQALTELGINRQ